MKNQKYIVLVSRVLPSLGEQVPRLSSKLTVGALKLTANKKFVHNITGQMQLDSIEVDVIISHNNCSIFGSALDAQLAIKLFKKKRRTQNIHKFALLKYRLKILRVDSPECLSTIKLTNLKQTPLARQNVMVKALDTLLDRPADCCYATVADMALHAKRGMALHSLAKDVQPSLMSAKLSSLLGYRCDYTLLDPLTKSN